MDTISFEIKRMIGALSHSEMGWSKELNIVSWNTNPAKYDIRDWSPDHDRMTRGITLYESEARALYELLKKEFEV